MLQLIQEEKNNFEKRVHRLSNLYKIPINSIADLLKLYEKLAVFTGHISLNNPDELIFKSCWNIQVILDRETLEFNRIELHKDTLDDNWDFVSYDDKVIISYLRDKLTANVLCGSEKQRYWGKRFLRLLGE